MRYGRRVARHFSFPVLKTTFRAAAMVFFCTAAAGQPAESGQAPGIQEAARQAAEALVKGLRAREGALPGPLAVSRFAGSPSETARTFATLVFQELSGLGVSLVDRQAMERFFEEAQLAGEPPEKVVEKLRGKTAARILVVGTLWPEKGALLANLRAVGVENGLVLATASASFAIGGGASASEALSLRARLRRLSDRLVEALDRLDGELRYQRIAVFPFEEAGETTRRKELGLLVVSELITRLGGEHRLLLVERDQLATVIKELELGMSGAVEPERAAQAGRLAGAEAIVLGAVAEAGDRYLVTARVVSSSSGKVQATEQEELPAADLIALSSEAVVLRSTWGAVYRSALLPGWGQLYNRQPVKAAVFAGAELAAVGLILGFHFHGAQLEDEYHSLPAGTDPLVFADKAAEAGRAFEWRNAFIYTLVGIHALNVLDALLNGKDFQSAAASSGPPTVGLVNW